MCKYMQTYANICKYIEIYKYMQIFANIYKCMEMYANICSVSKFSGIAWAVRISNSESDEELFGGRISNYGFAPDVFVGSSAFE